MTSARKKAWYESNKVRVIARVSRARMRRLYKITPETLEFILNAQDRRCRICQMEAKNNLHGTLYPDHDHKTGLLRGLLCHQCNIGLGVMEDDPERLLRAASYLLIAARRGGALGKD